MAEEKKEKKLDSKLEANIRSANFTLFFAFVSSIFLTLLSIWFFFEALLIDDVELIFKYTTLKFFTLDLNVNVFPLVSSAFISVVYIINLILLDKLFSQILTLKGKLDKLEEEFLIKKVYRIFYGTDFYKLFVFANFVLIPLIALATIMYKFLAIHNILVVGGTSLLLILSSLGAFVFLVRRYEEFDFHEIADHIIGLIFIIFLTIVFIYLYFIFLSFINASNQTLFKWFTFVVIPLPMIIYLFLAAKVFPKNKKALDVTQLFIPVIFVIMAVVVFVVNSVFIFMKNIPQKFNYAYGLIPKIEIKGEDFIKLYLLGFKHYVEKNKPSETEIINTISTRYLRIKNLPEYQKFFDDIYYLSLLSENDRKKFIKLRFCEKYIKNNPNKEIPKNLIKVCSKNLLSERIYLEGKVIRIENFDEILKKKIFITSHELALRFVEPLNEPNKRKFQIYEARLRSLEADIRQNMDEYLKNFIKEYYEDFIDKEYSINIYDWLLPVSNPIYYRIMVFEKKFETLLSEGFDPNKSDESGIIYYIQGEKLPYEFKEFYYRSLSEGKPMISPSEEESGAEAYKSLQDKKFMFINLVSSDIKKEYIYLTILKYLVEEKSFVELLSIDKLLEKNRYSNNTEAKFELAKLRIILDILNFKGKNLRYAHLINVYSELANFEEADLEGSNIPLSILNYVNFTNAKLDYADLNASWFFYSIFNKADLTKASLKGSYISNSLFLNTKLKEVNLSNSYIKNSLFVNVDFRKANLSDAYIMTSIFIDPKFDENVDINKTKLSESSLFLVSDPKNFKKKLKNPDRIKFNNLSNWYYNYGRKIIFIYKIDKNGRRKIAGIRDKVFLLYFIYTLNYIKNHPKLAEQINGEYKGNTLREEAEYILRNLKTIIDGLNISQTEKESIFAIEQGSIPIKLIDKETYKAILILLTLIISSASICYYCKEYI